MQELHEIIRELREDKGLRQEDIAQKLGISQQTYSHYELGCADFSSRHLVKIATIYGITTDYLFGCPNAAKYYTNNLKILSNGISMDEYIISICRPDEKELYFLSYF